MPTPFELGSLILAAIALAGLLVSDGRARARNEIVAERVKMLEALPERVTKLEAADGEAQRALNRHYTDDMAALDRIARAIKDAEERTVREIAELRADLRRSRNEDTDPGRRT